MTTFKTKENLKKASPEELAKAAGINEAVALELWKMLQE